MTPFDQSLLIAWHSRTGTARALAQAAADGAGNAARLIACEEVTPEHLLAAGGYLFVCPENLASMSGAMKEMFDRCYYPVLGAVEGRAYATIIAAGTDGEGAQRQLDRITTGWRLRRVAEPMIVRSGAQTADAIMARKTIDSAQRGAATALGTVMAEGLRLGIF